MEKFYFFTRISYFVKIILFAVLVAGCSGNDDSIDQDSILSDSQPQGFNGLTKVETLSSSQLTLFWELSTNPEIISYNVYDVRLPSTPVLIKTVSSSSNSTIISGLDQGFIYKYRVKAVADGNKEDGNEIDLFGIPHAGVQNAVVVTATSAQIFFNEVTQTEVTEGRVYCQEQNSSDWTLFATVTDLSLSSVVITGLQQNTTYTCRYNVVIDGQEDNNLERQTFTALGRAFRISFDPADGAVQPGNGPAGQLLTVQPQVVILDENDNVVAGGPDATALITLTVSVSSPSGGTVRGTASVNAVQGVASFTDLFMQEAGIKILTATKEDTSSLVFGTASMSSDSDSFTVSPGNISPALSSISISPNGSPALIANGVDSYQVIFDLRDEFGSPVSGIVPTFSSNVIGDAISPPSTPSDASGQTSGSISTTIADTNQPGVTRILNISSPAGLESLTVAAPFDPGSANQLAFTIQPQNSPAGTEGLNNNISVSIQDSFSNVITSGPSSSDLISLNISNNVSGATLLGTVAVNAVNGVAVFSDLGIDQTANGYRLSADSGSLLPATSNSFNITAGIPRVIDLAGPTDVLSGACSAAVTVQLQDNGGNPAKATQLTSVLLSNLGNAQIYSNSSCSGAPLSTTVQFNPGTDTRTIYLTSDKVESLNVAANDASGVLTPDNYPLLVTPSKMRLIAEAASPAPPGQDLVVPSASCSTAMYIEPLAEDNSIGQVYTPTTVSLSGLNGSQAQIYSDATCTNLVDFNSIPLTQAASPNHRTIIYIMGPASESLDLNVIDLAGNIQTTSILQNVEIVASEIDLTGPSTVVSGVCSDPFTLVLEDSQGNPSFESDDITLTVNGLGSYPSGEFFVNDPACSGGGSGSSVLIPGGNSTVTLRFRGIASADLSIFLSDARGFLSDSQTINLSVTPSDLALIAPVAATSETNECVGPFEAEARDGAGSPSNVLSNTRVNLSGEGDAGVFYSDSSCEVEVDRVTIGAGSNSTNFWFQGFYPESSLTLNIADHAGVLQSDSSNWSVTAALGFIGSVSDFGPNPVAMPPFSSNVNALQSEIDGFKNAFHMAFDPNYEFLYVVDESKHRILKYDYVNNEYVGWVGRLERRTPTGSNVATPSAALCVNTSNYQVLPGWCVGGKSTNDLQETGGLYNPRGITVDNDYVYVVNRTRTSVGRYDVATGSFEGWIGTMNNPSGAIDAIDDGSTANDLCPLTSANDPTPTWCIGGDNKDGAQDGNGEMHDGRSIAHDNAYLYVGTESAVLRYNKVTGAFEGWIGRVNNSTPTSNAPGGSGDCTTTSNNAVTPGWCLGGNYHRGDPRDTGFMHYSVDVFVDATDLYVMSDGFGATINRYDKVTGAYLGTLTNHNKNWTGRPGQIDWDPVQARFLIANSDRMLKVDTTGLIEGWIGKVSNGFGMSGPGCTNLNANENTPGWCIGGDHKPGLDEGAFGRNYGIAYDGNGSFLTVSYVTPKIQKFNALTGAYEGSLAVPDNSPDKWIADYNAISQGQGVSGNAASLPEGVLIVGDFLFVTDREAARVKKINKKTGELIGMIGGMTTAPTGGDPACSSANAMSPAPGWCTGHLPYPNDFWNTSTMIDDLVQGILHTPWGLASDGTWLYIVDQVLDNVHRFRVDNGTYGGWFGRVGNASPTGGPGNNCLGASQGTFTDGWCFGGRSERGTSSDGAMREPQGITFANGNLYVVDMYNHRINSYNATTGQYNGWIGAINANPSSGCSPVNRGNSYNVSGSGWCIGGTSRAANGNSDRGGGFRFNTRADVFSDGLHLYVTNTENSRIDKFDLNGQFIEAAAVRRDEYSNVWESTEGDVGAIGSRNCGDSISVWSDTNYIYGLNRNPCHRNEYGLILWKMNKSTGTIYGWKGAIGSESPTGGEVGCLGASIFTPAWCQGGRATIVDLLGGFAGSTGMLTGDDDFLYVTDPTGNRVIRVPK